MYVPVLEPTRSYLLFSLRMAMDNQVAPHTSVKQTMKLHLKILISVTLASLAGSVKVKRSLSPDRSEATDKDPREFHDGDGGHSRTLQMGGKGGKGSYQVDYSIRRPQVVGAHTKWSLCTNQYYIGGGKCEARQQFVPKGYYFETGRLLPEGVICSDLTGNGDVPVVKCRLKRGVTLVLPVVSQPYYACTDQGKIEDPRIGPSLLMDEVCNYEVLKATLDGVPISMMDSTRVVTQDGDGNNRLAFGRATCTDYFGDFALFYNCPLYASGEYVFIDTTSLRLGNHTLVLIGQDNSDSSAVFCSAVRFEFNLVYR